MDNLEQTRKLIREILTEYTTHRYLGGGIQNETIFDTETDRYIVMMMGRENKKRVHGCLIHVEIIDGKIWIQRDGTQDGIATLLVENGIPKDKIVLGFKSPEMRQYTEFAAA
jgi:XisI protein